MPWGARYIRTILATYIHAISSQLLFSAEGGANIDDHSGANVTGVFRRSKSSGRQSLVAHEMYLQKSLLELQLHSVRCPPQGFCTGKLQLHLPDVVITPTVSVPMRTVLSFGPSIDCRNPGAAAGQPTTSSPRRKNDHVVTIGQGSSISRIP